MLLTPAVALVLAAQQIPNNASVIYAGIPASSKTTTVQMVTHDAKAQLARDSVQLSSLSFLKNLSNKDATVTIELPVRGHNIVWGMVETLRIQAWVDNAPAAVTIGRNIFTAPGSERSKASGVRAETLDRAYLLTIPFKGRQAHSLRVSCSSAIGKAGLDGAQRVVAYDVTGASTWAADVDQMNFSLSYTPRIVFQVFAALPPNAWEIGPNGAFIKQTHVRPVANSKIVFTYYPGGFDKIGGSR